jgi:xanthine dehydrogenase accessory factor
MSDWLPLSRAWAEAQIAGDRALLFTVVDIQGSAYRKLGARMLVSENGIRAGSVSAGCIESDILLRLPDLMASPFLSILPTCISYDNRGEDLFAFNQGCAGAICIHVEELHGVGNHAMALFELARTTRRPMQLQLTIDESRVYNETILPPIRLLAFGAHQDARALGALADMVDFEFEHIERIRGDRLNSVKLDERTAVAIMSHNYEADKLALSAVLDTNAGYIGIMGPRKRTEQILRELRCISPPATLQFPIGLDIGADSANQIAISIIGEILAKFAHTSGTPLTMKESAIHACRMNEDTESCIR